jgi:hypothetical protein
VKTLIEMMYQHARCSGRVAGAPAGYQMTVLPVIAAKVTGLPALLIILVILAVLIVGAVTIFRAAGRGAKRVAGKVGDDSR